MPTKVRETDVDDTADCPVEERCFGCGERDDLAVATAEAIGLGVFCLTLCAVCCDAPLPNLVLADAAARVLEHCGHLGIGLDQMTAAVNAEREPR